MNASKESTAAANTALQEAAGLLDATPPDVAEIKRRLLIVQDFLDAAARKLPTEAAYAKDAKKKRPKKK